MKVDLYHCSTPKIGLLVKDTALKPASLREYYVDRLTAHGVLCEDVAAYPLLTSSKPKGKLKKADLVEYAKHLLSEMDKDGITIAYVCDGDFFKYLAGVDVLDLNLGYVIPCVVPGFEHMNMVYGISYATLFHVPSNIDKINAGLDAVGTFQTNKYFPPGADLFTRMTVLKNVDEIKNILQQLHNAPALAADIETRSLHFRDAGISTIAFATSQDEAFAFPVDTHGGLAQPVRNLLKEFFTNYKGKLIWHNIAYDAKVLIYNLWMNSPLDLVGMRQGIEVMTRCFDDTRLIAYLALNSCSRVSYGLKHLAQSFAGNYGNDEISDVMSITPEELLQYNMLDTKATWFVHNKYYQKMIDDNQLDLYENLFKDSVRLLLEIELTGMPIDMDKVLHAERELLTIKNKHLDSLNASPIISQLNKTLQHDAWQTKQSSLKVKVVNLDDFVHVQFNPGSPKQLTELLYNQLQLPVVDLTKTKLPSTGAKTMKKLKAHTKDPLIIQLLDDLIGISKTSKILEAFIPTFKDAWLKADGCYYLHGNFKLGFVVSGRLSCSAPNLQQIPSGSTYGALIKDCFIAPKGWIMAGADFNSLEDMISALTTRDPNKLKVYVYKFDGHCLRAYKYFGNAMPDIIDTRESINSIEVKYPELRQLSKAPTFALTYLGTYLTLMANCGFSESVAKGIEQNYHELYQEADRYIHNKLVQASKDGYVTAAFGLRVRTPLLAQTLFGTGNKIPREAAAESRTAGNALGQSYCMLNNRAAAEFRKRLLNSEYAHDVRLLPLIHDAIYVLIRNDVNVVKWVNDNLPACMAWQDLPELQHDTVKIGGELELYYPSWKYKYKIPLDASTEDIVNICKKESK